ncbi:O-antigen ligase family protein [Streptomyces sp. NPDC050658]|uniref:O-antigen ligase family protein n=1 Tax=unclassified Streptomyces TaxID=2593676 RepID=UPI003444DCF2
MNEVLAVRLRIVVLWIVGVAPAGLSALVLSGVYEPPKVWSVRRAWGSPAAAESLGLGASPPAQLLALLLVPLLVTTAVLGCALARRGRSAAAFCGTLAVGLAVLYGARLLSALTGRSGGAGRWDLWLPLLVTIALCLAPRPAPGDVLPHLRGILRAYTWGALAALALFGTAETFGYPDTAELRLGFLPGRFMGTGLHPNLLGPLAAFALAAECVPLRRARLWPLHAAAAATVLLLTQSRTSWLACVLGLLLLHRPGAHRMLHPLLARTLGVGAAVGLALPVPGAVAAAARAAGSGDIGSLHGRHLPWRAAREAFEAHPLLGYGPRLFTDPLSPVGGAFGHAHNQLLQVLATSGLVGAAGLLLFAVAAVRLAVRSFGATAGLSAAWLTMTAVVGVTEVPLSGTGLWVPTALTSLLVCALLMAPTGAPPLPLQPLQERPLPCTAPRRLPSPASSA